MTTTYEVVSGFNAGGSAGDVYPGQHVEFDEEQARFPLSKGWIRPLYAPETSAPVYDFGLIDIGDDGAVLLFNGQLIQWREFTDPGRPPRDQAGIGRLRAHGASRLP